MQLFGNNTSNNKNIWQQEDKTNTTQKHFNLLSQSTENQINQHYQNYSIACKRARMIKWDGIENIAELLEQFEENWEQHSNKIIWAAEAQTALSTILEKLNATPETNCLIAPGGETIEIELTALLEKNNLPFLFLNWEYQLAYDLNLDSNHLTFPLLGYTETEILKLCNNIYETKHENFEQFKIGYRQYLNEHKNENTYCILTADYLVPEFGGIVFNDNSAYVNWCLANFKNIIIISGIDKVLVDDDYTNELTAIDNINKKGSNNNQLCFLFNQPNKNINLILLDNARSDLLKNPLYRKLLYDLDGSLWQNTHPESGFINTKNTHDYHFGPISALLTPLLYNETEDNSLLNHLSLWKNKLPNSYKLNYLNLLIQFKRLHLKHTTEKPKSNLSTKIKGIFSSNSNFHLNNQNIGAHKQMPKMASKTFLQSLKN